MITLQFSAASDPFSRLICKWTWSPYSHVDLVLPDGRLLGALFHGGVCIHAPRSDYVSVARFTLPISFDAYYKQASSQLGAAYDLMGAVGIPFRRDWQEHGKWFCSELHAWASKEVGFPIVRTEKVNRITPRDLLLSPLLKSIPVGSVQAD